MTPPPGRRVSSTGSQNLISDRSFPAKVKGTKHSPQSDPHRRPFDQFQIKCSLLRNFQLFLTPPVLPDKDRLDRVVIQKIALWDFHCTPGGRRQRRPPGAPHSTASPVAWCDPVFSAPTGPVCGHPPGGRGGGCSADSMLMGVLNQMRS